MSKPVLTKIIPNPANSANRDLYLDDQFYLTIPAELLFQLDLAVGMPFDETGEAQLLFEAKRILAKEKALQFLDYGDISRRRLLEKLVRSGFEPDVAEAACAQIEALDLLNDRRLAFYMAERFAEGKHWGPRRILPELMQRGIPTELAKEAVNALNLDYGASIRQLLATKYRLVDWQDRKAHQRAVQGLQRYGFNFEDIHSAILQFVEDDYD